MYPIRVPMFGNMTAVAMHPPMPRFAASSGTIADKTSFSDSPLKPAASSHNPPETGFKRNLRLGFQNLTGFISKNWNDGSVKGKILVVLDVLMTLLSFVPFLHFAFLVSPSFIAAYKGFFLGKPL